jgi:hypothetical protein
MPWFCLKYNINSCGNEIPDMMYQHVQYVFEHNQSTLTFMVESDFQINNCDLSFGLDDFQIYI